MRLLVVEDDPMIGKAVQQGLAAAGFTVDWARDGRTADLALANGVYDLVVLDLGLPAKDGMAVLATLRGGGNQVPVLVATARDAVAMRIAGLNAGADDYLVKPFDLDELVARVRALLRRHAGSGTAVLEAGSLVLDPVRRTLLQDGQPVAVSPREFTLLEILMRRPGAVISREKLEESIYGWDEEIGSNAVEVHLSHLRRKLGAAAIVNVRGVGWRVAD
ncbi:MAG: response regulator [Pseudomonadota bacterium]